MDLRLDELWLGAQFLEAVSQCSPREGGSRGSAMLLPVCVVCR